MRRRDRRCPAVGEQPLRCLGLASPAVAIAAQILDVGLQEFDQLAGAGELSL
jgi:hypothetical protein